MLAQRRRRRILEELTKKGAIQTTRMARLLGVSPMTIRRDVEVLHSEHLIRRVRGGAVRLEFESPTKPTALVVDSRNLVLGAAALDLVRDGMVVGLSGGSALPELTRLLLSQPNLTVVSNSLLAARVVAERQSQGLPCARLLLTGGVRAGYDSLTGPVTTGALGKLYTDLCFLDLTGVRASTGFTIGTPEEAEVVSLFARRTSRTVVAAPDSILGVTAACVIESLSRVDVLLLGDDVAPAARESLHDRAGEIVRVHRGAPAAERAS